MNKPTETTVPTTPEPTPFPRLGRWLDMVDQALGIGPHRTEEH